MSEQDKIRKAFAKISMMATKDAKKKDEEELIEAGVMMLRQVVLDLNRIANALEKNNG